jgi:hypothetical protein
LPSRFKRLVHSPLWQSGLTGYTGMRMDQDLKGCCASRVTELRNQWRSEYSRRYIHVRTGFWRHRLLERARRQMGDRLRTRQGHPIRSDSSFDRRMPRTRRLESENCGLLAVNSVSIFWDMHSLSNELPASDVAKVRYRSDQVVVIPDAFSTMPQ